MSSVETRELLAEVQALIREREEEGVRGLAERIGPPEWADLVPQLEPREVAVLLQWLPDEEIPALLEELPPAEAARILRTLAQPEAAELLEEMDPDDAADVLEELPDSTADEILIRMSPEDAAEIRELAAYAADTRRRPDDPRVRRRPVGCDQPPRPSPPSAGWSTRRRRRTTSTSIDAERRLLGVLSSYRLLLSPPETPVAELMAPTTVRVRASADQEAAARLLTDRNLLAIPVVDDDDRLLGIITEDDVADVLEAEATEDIERLGGSQPLNLPYRLAERSAPRPQARASGCWPAVRGGRRTPAPSSRASRPSWPRSWPCRFFIPLLIGTGGNIGSPDGDPDRAGHGPERGGDARHLVDRVQGDARGARSWAGSWPSPPSLRAYLLDVSPDGRDRRGADGGRHLRRRRPPWPRPCRSSCAGSGSTPRSCPRRSSPPSWMAPG